MSGGVDRGGAEATDSMSFAYTASGERAPQLGLIALQSDETVEQDMRRLLPMSVELLVTRVPSALEVTPDTLATMELHLTGAAALFPRSARFAAVAYGCTSGTAQIGAGRVADLIGDGTVTQAVTQPVSSLIAACEALGLRRLALLSPYVAPVSDRLRAVLAEAGIETPRVGTFDESLEERVARIPAASIIEAATALMQGARVDGLFLSCTNLRTLDVIAPLEDRLGVPVLSSNLVLAWHLLGHARMPAAPGAPGRLFRGPAPPQGGPG